MLNHLLESNLHKSFQDNFLTKELKVIEENWGFNLESIIEEYMKTYKGKNLIPKGALKELLQSRIELRLEECLNHSTWNIHREKQYPAPLPLNLRNPPPELLTLRLHTLLPPPNELCTKCGSKTSCPTLHALLECQHALCSLCPPLPNVASLPTR